jgi:glutaredoxin 3
MSRPTKIRVYSTTTCPYCKMEKTWLENHDVKFDFVLVDQNRAEAEHMIKSTGQMGVPVTELLYDDKDPEYIIGFDQALLADRIGL